MQPNTEQFITKATVIHNNKYNYSKVNYINAKTKVTITCPVHGEFQQPPYDHLSGHGCGKCAVELRARKGSLTTKQFIERAVNKHGTHYNYSKVNYINNHNKIVIGCPTHGDFEQIPNSHLLGQGCPICGGRLQSNTEQFIQKAKIVHGDLYDYSKVEYIKARLPVIITCKTHGDFTQLPNNHLSGQGCPSCMKRVIVDTDEFIRRAKDTHGNKYDYSRVKFFNGKTYLTIGCPVHGDFEQSASEHIRGRGCKQCASELTGELNKYSKEDFVNKAIEVHGDRFDYSKTIYIDIRTPIVITCKTHGDYSQVPNNHLQGSGCPTCKSSKGELVIAKILDKHNIKYVQEYIIPNQQYKFRYDFYLPDRNLFIEYHGLQHYKPIEFFGGREAFLELKIRDDMKKTLAKSLGYKFEEVKYTALLNLSEEEFEKRLLFNIFKYSAL